MIVLQAFTGLCRNEVYDYQLVRFDNGEYCLYSSGDNGDYSLEWEADTELSLLMEMCQEIKARE